MFIERLLSLIAEKGISKKQFNEDVQINKNQLKRWQDTGTIPNRTTLTVIANYFNVSVEYLKGETDIREKEKTPLPNTDKEDVILELFKNLPIEKQKEIIVEYMSKADEETQSKIVQAFISALGNQG